MTNLKRKANRQALIHEVRTSGQNFDQIVNGCRNFLVVEDNRAEGYEIGDLLIIQKISDRKKVGEPIRRTVLGFQKTGRGLMYGFIVLALTETEGQNFKRKMK